MKKAALKDVAPAKAARVTFSPKDIVWQLNLDQIEAQSGRILSKVTGLASAAGSSTQTFDTGNVLYSKLRPYLNKVVCPDSPGIATTELVPLRPDPKQLDRQYLTYYLRSPEFVTWISNEVAGAKMPRVTMKVFWDHKIPLPPLAEQKRIAAILDAADALRAKRREAIAQLDALLQSSFLTLFGDPVTNPMGWERITLGELAREKPNNGIFRKNPDYVQEGKSGLPVVWVEELFRGSSINTEESRRVIPAGTEIQKYGLKYGDVLFCRSSLKLDGIAFNNVYLGGDNEALFECHVIRISPDLTRASPIYLNTLLRSPKMRAIAKSKSKTATMTTIDQKGICSLEIPLPPLELQQVFDSQVAAIEKLKLSHRAHLVELDALFSALQHRAFRGEL